MLKDVKNNKILVQKFINAPSFDFEITFHGDSTSMFLLQTIKQIQ